MISTVQVNPSAVRTLFCRRLLSSKRHWLMDPAPAFDVYRNSVQIPMRVVLGLLL
jgi:hypothetical protein